MQTVNLLADVVDPSMVLSGIFTHPLSVPSHWPIRLYVDSGDCDTKPSLYAHTEFLANLRAHTDLKEQGKELPHTLSLYSTMSHVPMSAYSSHFPDRPMSASLADYRSPSRGSLNFDTGHPRSAMPTGSAGTFVDNDDLLSIQLGTRPSSSLGRYEMYAELSQSATVINTPVVSSFPLISFFEKLSTNPQLTSHTLDLRIQKLIKSEKKVMRQQQELIKDITSWCNILPNDDCKRLMYHFIKILEVEFDINEQAIKKQCQIIGQLSNVNKREKRTNDLKWKRNKILAKLRESENKVGDSPVTLLTKENLEELECSVEIVEDQFIRSVNNGLKNSLVDYVMTLRNTGVKLKDSSNYFLENYSFASKPEQTSTSLQKLILQNKLNGAGLSRDITNSVGLNSLQYIDKAPSSARYSGESDYGVENLDTISEEKQDADIALKNSTSKAKKALKHSNALNKEHTEESSSFKTGAMSSDQNSLLSESSMPGGLESFNIINSYSTPGALNMLPGGHQWGT